MEHSSTPYQAEQSSRFIHPPHPQASSATTCGLDLSEQTPDRGDQSSVNLSGAGPQILGAQGNNQEGLYVTPPEREL